MGASFDLEFMGDDPHSSCGSAWVVVKWNYGPRNIPVVTHDCGTPKEFEYWIGVLHEELDEVLRQARVKFAANMMRKAEGHEAR